MTVGDKGPAGGYIFYDKKFVSDGWRYLEAAPYGWYDGTTDSTGSYTGDDDPFFQWGAFGYCVEPSAAGIEIGTGAINTSNIVNYHDSLSTLYPDKGNYYLNPTAYYSENDGTVAAKICDDYSLENEGVEYSDWFLPSKIEIYYMCKNIHRLGGFILYDYWSSSVYGIKGAWRVNPPYLNFSSLYHNNRFNSLRVRPVRAF